ncbi:MAG: hypothetical protein IJ074_02275 [Clostridia bacterium]|nr:hypothetical protein [Clostridia bacterium]
MTREHIQWALSEIGEATPMRFDCGRLCGAACCAADEDGKGGVYLLPDEAQCMGDVDWGDIERDNFGKMLVCEADCDRERRPFGCRIFALTPFRRTDGTWSVRMDARARPICPLVRWGIQGLDPRFTQGVLRAVQALAQTAEGEAFLDRWQALEAQYRFEL